MHVGEGSGTARRIKAEGFQDFQSSPCSTGLAGTQRGGDVPRRRTKARKRKGTNPMKASCLYENGNDGGSTHCTGLHLVSFVTWKAHHDGFFGRPKKTPTIIQRPLSWPGLMNPPRWLQLVLWNRDFQPVSESTSCSICPCNQPFPLSSVVPRVSSSTTKTAKMHTPLPHR